MTHHGRLNSNKQSRLTFDNVSPQKHEAEPEITSAQVGILVLVTDSNDYRNRHTQRRELGISAS
jgi:hypothetical protein